MEELFHLLQDNERDIAHQNTNLYAHHLYKKYEDKVKEKDQEAANKIGDEIEDL
jgi:hypothetical protein